MERAIKLNIPWDEGRLNVAISEVAGAGGSWHVSADGYHCGSIFYTEHNGWQFGFNAKSEFDGDDIRVMIDLIETALDQYPG